MRGLRLRILMLTLLCAAGFYLSPPGVAFAADDSADSAHEPDEKGGGVPLDPATDLAFWSLVVFIVFILVLKKFAWGPLTEGLDKRESRVRQDIADAEAARVKAEAMLAEHQQKLNAVQNEVKEILASARRDAEQAGQRIVAEAQAQADANKERAIAEIEQSKDQALQELFGAMAGQVASATEYVLGHGMTAGDQDRLIQEALAELSNGKT